jgi:hypothetical protein
MQKLSSAPLPEGPPQIKRDKTSALLLRAPGIHLDMLAAYHESLEAFVFPHANTECGSKLLIKYRRILRTPDAGKVLAITWKESEFVSDEALTDAGLSRVYNEKDLTAHSLAVALAESPQDVGKLNSQIRNIGIAAAAHQLIGRDELHSTKVLLRGTFLLHDFMVNLSEKYITAIANFIPVAPTTLSPTIQDQR